MADANEELLQGVHNDPDHPKAATHAAKLDLREDGEGHVLTVDISAHAESPPHHTSFLDLYVNDTPAGSINPQPPHYTGKFEIEMTDLDVGDTVRCQAKCNLHGVWESSVDV